MNATTPSEAIVILNAGSTSLKFGVYRIEPNGSLHSRCRGQISHMQSTPHFNAHDANHRPLGERSWEKDQAIDHKTALNFLIIWLEQELTDVRIVAAGHRFVMGGTRYTAPVLLDGESLEYLESLSEIEPSHQPYNVLGAHAFADAFPGRPQVACFDTSFHRTMPAVAQTYAIPQAVRDAGVRHWGFHGISYDYISQCLPTQLPDSSRVVVAHLGGGASLCAMLNGQSMETTMGFGGLSGLMMATRSGDIPADALLYLLRSGRFDASSLEKMLYENSGLLGLSGASGDMRVLQNSEDPQARFAIECFVYAMQKYIGAYAMVLGGLDSIVFTAGIGENSSTIRAALCDRLSWLDVKLDATANANNERCISSPYSSVSVWVIPTDEELLIARYTASLLRPDN